jgi:hypothetical protein
MKAKDDLGILERLFVSEARTRAPERIHTDFNVYWSAVLDGYDGAPDAKGRRSLVGRGTTEAAAVADLMEKLEDEE